MTTIFIISKLPMFGEGIEEILRCKGGVQILGFERDIPTAIERIAALNPEIVIFDCKEVNGDIHTAIMQILEKRLNIKIIGLDIQTNTFFVYTQEQHEIKILDDLFQEFE